MGASIVGGLIVLVAGFVLTSAVKDLELWQLALMFSGLAVLVAIAISLIKRSWRLHVWVTLGKWLAGLGVLTTKKRANLVQQGADQRSREVATQRAQVRQPAWTIDARDALGERNLFWLNNSGGVATEVRLSADPDFFKTEGDVYWQAFNSAGGMGSSVGAWFKGYATDRSNAEGVEFAVTWLDAYGDSQEKVVRLSPKEIRAGREEALQEEWAKGRSYGRQEMLEESYSSVPAPKPRWLIRQGPDFETFVIENRVERSLAREVHLESTEFEFRDGAHWKDLSGKTTEQFAGVPTAYKNSIEIRVEWYAESSALQTEIVNVDLTDWVSS